MMGKPLYLSVIHLNWMLADRIRFSMFRMKQDLSANIYNFLSFSCGKTKTNVVPWPILLFT